MTRLWANILRDETGAIAVEVAILLPTLLLMSLGAFEASMMVARQMDLQNAAAEASQIALAAAPTDAAARATVKSVIVASTGVDASGVQVLERYRCGTTDLYVSDATTCVTTYYSRFIEIQITETYTPSWAQITGMKPLTYNVSRMVQVG